MAEEGYIRYSDNPADLRGRVIFYDPYDNVIRVRCIHPEYNFVEFELYRELLPEEVIVLIHSIAVALAGKPAGCETAYEVVERVLERKA